MNQKENKMAKTKLDGAVQKFSIGQADLEQVELIVRSEQFSDPFRIAALCQLRGKLYQTEKDLQNFIKTITPVEAVRRLIEYQKMDDDEMARWNANELLADLLKDLGHKEVSDAYWKVYNG